MDLERYFRVVWRFKQLIVIGLLLAIALSFLSYASVKLSGAGIDVQPRGNETWQAQSTLLITQDGFPYGRAVPRYTDPGPAKQTPAVQEGDQTRFAALSNVYSQLANSNTVQAAVKSHVPVQGTVMAEAAVDPNGAPLPLVTIKTTARTAAEASTLARGATLTFRDYVSRRQTEAGIAASERVVLQVLESGGNQQLLSPRKKTLPALIFMAVLAATLALAFVLENVGAASRPVPSGDRVVAAVPAAEPTRRTA
jgi:hypothetical protein